MRTRSLWAFGTAATICAVVGIAAVSQALPSPATAAKSTGDRPGTTYTFVDSDLSRDKIIVNYVLPKLPPGPYAVSLFAGLEPTDGATSDNLYCDVRNSTSSDRVLVVLTEFTGAHGTFVSGASSTRVTKDSVLRATCSAEYGSFNYSGDPLRITFTRLASMTTQQLDPSSTSPAG